MSQETPIDIQSKLPDATFAKVLDYQKLTPDTYTNIGQSICELKHHSQALEIGFEEHLEDVIEHPENYNDSDYIFSELEKDYDYYEATGRHVISVDDFEEYVTDIWSNPQATICEQLNQVKKQLPKWSAIAPITNKQDQTTNQAWLDRIMNQNESVLRLGKLIFHSNNRFLCPQLKAEGTILLYEESFTDPQLVNENIKALKQANPLVDVGYLALTNGETKWQDRQVQIQITNPQPQTDGGKTFLTFAITDSDQKEITKNWIGRVYNDHPDYQTLLEIASAPHYITARISNQGKDKPVTLIKCERIASELKDDVPFF